MSDLIHLLPDSVANQIAAGEVIQRPASVIKELVENSVDAGAATIHVIVVDAGRTSIQVIDDGKGMSETDARLSFERHATSKILQADDLFALNTMGFRGEALASIAAVAQVELQTRRQEDEIGTKISIAGSKVVGQEPVSCPVGSNFKVDNLFFNVPARRKFLKTNATELNNILTAFERIVLVYPAIHFTLHHNGVEMLNLRAGSVRQRIADVFGKQYNQDLVPVEVHTAMCTVTGFVGKPEAARKKSGCDYFFVNGRFMKHPYFHKAVMKAYDRLVPEGMAIPYFLYLEVAPGEIDVNIHPTKTEIKFENEQAIWQILSAAVRDGIGKYCEVPSIDFDTQGQPDIPVFNQDMLQESSYTAPKVNYNPDYNPFKQSSGGHSSNTPNQWESLYEGLKQDSFPQDSFPQQPSLFDDDNIVEPQTASEILSEKSPAHYQYKGKYLMTAVKSGLMIIDQHRASVRVLYDRYLKEHDGHVISTQKLLFPETITLSPSEAVNMQQLLPELMAYGFDLSDLGGNTYAVNGIPAGLEGVNPQNLLHDMISSANAADTLVSIQSSLALRLAQRAAIPYGQLLTNDEIESIINDLFSCSNVNYTPDGKAILCILPQGDIERLLG
ncbi:DNA mismatch repair endonuclease MutL [Prevotella sp. MA2016]|uniref:DNA mismatch repair endonuclease MutL n=1 Tax=Prevotella sp. MA2016 TaxID=1408310 RepID=UPI00048C76FF|nr:DNA mismatch repair endonuclease MutL [Prevotella sp. MA2016]